MKQQLPLFGKILKVLGIILIGLTSIVHLLGGAGTTCAAFSPEKYDNMSRIIPFQWLYILFVFATIAYGLLGVRATIQFARGKEKAYRDVLIALIISLIISAFHMFTSRILRGSSMPNDMRVYINAFTLIVFLIMGLPGLRKIMGTNTDSGKKTGEAGLGSAFIIMGVITLTVQFWVGNTHIINQINFADIWHKEFLIAGLTMIIIGIPLIVRAINRKKPVKIRVNT